MKYLKLILIIFSVMGLASMSEISAQEKGDKDKFTVNVDGLGCPFCAYGLEKKIKKLKGIKKVKIDMEEAKLTFDYPAEKLLTIAAVEAQVDEAGYTAMGTTVLRYNGEVEKSEFKISDKINQNRVVKASIPVAGTCGMCQSRIHKVTRKIEGVVECNWNEDTQILTVEYDKDLTNTEAIEEAVSAAGHDTQNMKAPDDVYENLPACCYYDRKSYNK